MDGLSFDSGALLMFCSLVIKSLMFEKLVLGRPAKKIELSYL